MTWLEVLAPAKVNLFLELISRRADGYHELETVMVKIGLSDRMQFRRRSDDQTTLSIRTACGSRHQKASDQIASDSSNLVWRAIDALRQATGRTFGLDVRLDKRIPVGAGLGGGSSDAASTLLALNRWFQLGLTPEELMQIGSQLGSDVPFFLSGGAGLCTGRGERVKELRTRGRGWFVVAMPPVGLRTGDVYGRASISQGQHSSHQICEAMRTGRIPAIGKFMRNRLQGAAASISHWIERLASEFDRVSAAGHQMSGSGSSYFGLFGSRFAAQNAARILRSRLPSVSTYCVIGLGRKPLMAYHQAE